MKYWEQTGNALNNLQDKDCEYWQSAWSMQAVTRDALFASFKRVPLKFRDMFDISLWNELSERHGYSSLTSLRYFFQHSTRRTVLVHLIYGGDAGCQEMNGVHVLTAKKWMVRNPQTERVYVNKVVWINFGHFLSHPLNKTMFADWIYEGVDHNVTVSWGGIHAISEPALGPLSDNSCLQSIVSDWKKQRKAGT